MAAARQNDMKDSITVVATTTLTRRSVFAVSALIVSSPPLLFAGAMTLPGSPGMKLLHRPRERMMGEAETAAACPCESTQRCRTQGIGTRRNKAEQELVE